jgi:hypothetical protein
MTVYTQEFEDQGRIIIWAWRELLVSALAQGKDTNVEQMIEDLLKIGHAKDVLELLTEGDGASLLFVVAPKMLISIGHLAYPSRGNGNGRTQTSQ